MDYLLKPVQIDHLERAMEKFSHHRFSKNDASLRTLRANLAQGALVRMALPVSDGLLMVDVSQMTHLEADGAYTHVYLNTGKHMLISKKLNYFQQRLEDNPSFMRIHRSHMIRLDHVSRFHKGSGIVELENGKNVRAST